MTPYNLTMAHVSLMLSLDPYTVNRTPYCIPNTTRKTLAKLFGQLGFRTGVEVGVERGAFSEQLCKHNPAAHVYGVDPWKLLPPYRSHVTQAALDGFYTSTCQRLAKYQWAPLRMTSVEAAAKFDDESLDFVYLDANHSRTNVLEDLRVWTPKVRTGGIIGGHDYNQTPAARGHEAIEVKTAVHEWTAAQGIHLWFVFGAEETVAGECRESSRSFMWVVE